MALPLPIALSPTPLGRGVLASASPLPAGWENGVEFMSGACLEPERVAVCPEDYEGIPDAVGSVTFLPFDTRQGVKCSAMSRLDVAALAGVTIDVTDEYLVGQELQDGLASGNPSLSDAANLGTATDVEEAIGWLEETAAAVLAGRLIVLHIPPLVAIHLPDILWRDAGGNLRTPLGSLVIISPGYTGSDIWATGEVYAAVGATEKKSAMDRALNTEEGWAERPAIVVFDPCFSAAVTTPIETVPSPA